jgi:hypothetical protein
MKEATIIGVACNYSRKELPYGLEHSEARIGASNRPLQPVGGYNQIRLIPVSRPIANQFGTENWRTRGMQLQ